MSLFVRGVAIVAVLWFAVPAIQSLGATVSSAREGIESWQQERVTAATCYYRTLDALDAGDERAYDAAAADCQRSR